MVTFHSLLLAAIAVVLFSDFGLVNSKRSKVITIALEKKKVTDSYKTQAKKTLIALKSPFVVQLRNVQDIYYTGPLSIGSPSQNFTVLYDTASSNIWVPSSLLCKKQKSYCKTHRTYDRESSSSARSSDKPFTIDYASGSISGLVVTDDVTIASLKINCQTFGEATHLDVLTKKLEFDGILGLGLPGSNRFGGTPPFMNLVNQGLIDDPVFALYLGKSKSELTIGGVDPSHYRGKFTFTPTVGKEYWLFSLDKVMVGQDTVSRMVRAIPDSGSSVVIGPPAIIDHINAKIGKMNKDTYTYVDCDNLASLPNVVFVINGRNFVLSPDDYIQVELMKHGKRRCYSGFDSSPSRYMILGDIFMAKYYTQFDAGNKRIGFAKARK